MTLEDLAKTALGNLGRHKVRTTLSAVGVTVGILTIVTMVSLGIGVQREVVGAFTSVGLETIEVRPVTEERAVFDQFADPKRTVIITPELAEELRARDDVVQVRPHIYLSGGGMRVYLEVAGEAVEVRAREPAWWAGVDDPFAKPPELVAGEDLASGAQGQVVVSARTLEKLGYDDFEGLIGQEVALVLVTPRSDRQEFPLRLVGVVDTHTGTNYPGAYIGAADAAALKAWWYNDPDLLAHDGYDALTVEAASLNDAAQIVALLQERGFEVESLKSALDTVNKAMTILQTMLGSIGGLALFVAAIGIANTMIMAVYERTREIGILKAVGASPGNIRLLFVAEASLIGLLGGIVGVIGGWLLGLGLNEAFLIYFDYMDIPMRGTFFFVTGWLVALALGFATVVGLLAGLYPAARAARLDPLEALRHG
ncbi:MAG: ABC transporter permease [Anaerolineae bacterium]|nr:ABC transporter permease [Anaerolineae bacterium]